LCEGETSSACSYGKLREHHWFTVHSGLPTRTTSKPCMVDSTPHPTNAISKTMYTSTSRLLIGEKSQDTATMHLATSATNKHGYEMSSDTCEQLYGLGVWSEASDRNPLAITDCLDKGVPNNPPDCRLEGVVFTRLREDGWPSNGIKDAAMAIVCPLSDNRSKC
jgi:hypothetical protein